jgi:type IV secretory pathway TraG/TraD family ATPase VirD4
MGQYKGYWLTDIPRARFAEVANTSLRRFGWTNMFVDDEIGTITANKEQSQDIMGTTWAYKFRVVMRWSELSESAIALKSIPEKSVVQVGTEGALQPVSKLKSAWTEVEFERYKNGCLVEVEIAEDAYTWSTNECTNRFKQVIEGAYIDSRKIVASSKKDGKGARWATGQELMDIGYVGNDINDRSLLISMDQENEIYFRLSEPDTNRHALVCGPTGTGKTTGIFVPNLIERTGVSAIVTEATGSKGRADLYSKTAGYRASRGHRIYYFNPDDLRSDRINPLDQVNSYREARRVVEIIMNSTTLSTHKGDQTWDMAERLLLTSIILHAVGEREEGNCNIGYVLKLLNKGAEKLGEILQDSNIEEAQESYQGFLNNSTESYRNLVAGGLITRLDLWKDPVIKALTETTDISFKSLESELFTWYMATPADKPELKPLAALVFNLALGVVGNSSFKHGVALFLDEFTNFGYVRGMPAKLSIIRHDKIPCVLGIQDYIQLELLYQKEAPLFLSQPGTRIFLRPNDLQTAERISKGLGMVEEIKRKVTSSGQIVDEKDKYPLLSLDELTNLDPTELVAFTPKTRPIKTKALSWQDFEEQTNEEEYPPPKREAIIVEQGLTRRDKKRPRESKDEPKKEQPAADDDSKQAATKSLSEVAAKPKSVVPANPLAWAKEIKVLWDPQNESSIVTYTPYCPLDQLDLLVYAWENKDPFVHKAMTEVDYWRVCAWIEARETTEQIDKLLDEETVTQIKKELEQGKTSTANKNLDDDFTGAWG